MESIYNIAYDISQCFYLFDRKRHRTTSSSKSSPVAKKETPATKSESREAHDAKLSSQSRSPSKSLSPLSTKMEMQEGKWQPPSNINTTSSFIPNLAVPPPTIESGYNYPPPGWPPTTVVVAPPAATIYQPPPTTYPVLPQPQGLIYLSLISCCVLAIDHYISGQPSQSL